jgi:hypothetical protein
MRGFFRSDDAQVVAVGVILTVAIVAFVISTIFLVYVPALKSDAEAKHMDEVAERFCELKSIVDQIEGSKSISIRMGEDKSSGRLHVNTSSGSFEVINRGEAIVAEPQGGDFCVVDDFDDLDGAQFGRMDKIGDFRVFFTPTLLGGIIQPYECMIKMEDGNEEWDVLFEAIWNDLCITVDHQSRIIEGYLVDPHWIDLYNLDDYGRGYELKKPPTSLKNGSLTIESKNAKGRYTMRYTGGYITREVEDRELSKEDAANANSLGYISYSSKNDYWMDEEFILENGCIIVDQIDGESMMIPPSIDITKVDKDKIYLNVSTTVISGVDTSIAGNGIGTVHLEYVDDVHLIGETEDDIILKIETEYPGLLEKFLEDKAEDGGLISREYDIDVDENVVTFEIEPHRKQIIYFSLDKREVIAKIS